MNKLSVRLWLGAVCLVLAGCTVSTKDTVLVGPPQRSTSSEVENNTGVSGAQQAIPSSIAILPFHNVTEEKVDRFNSTLKLDIHTFKVLLPGRLTKWKGQEMFLEALKLLKTKRNK